MRVPHLGLLFLLILTSCKQVTSYKQEVFPSAFPKVQIPTDNPFTKETVALGKQLFFEKGLSKNGLLSCASCHAPEKYFTDGLTLSQIGVSHQKLKRHSPTLINLAYATNGLFWDGGAKNLESLVFAPLFHPDEMGNDTEGVEGFLRSNEHYANGIKRLYDTDEVKIQYAAKAIAQYVRSIVSYQAKYDSVMAGSAHFSEAEIKGYQLFQQNCDACHTAPLFTDNEFHQGYISINYENLEPDSPKLGRYRITQDSTDLGKYKTPSLRNIEHTAPYMHDGAVARLEVALEHSLELNELSKQERQDLLAFLQTLNGPALVD